MKTLSVRIILFICLFFTILTVGIFRPNRVFADPAPFQKGDVFASIFNGRVQHYNAAGTFLETLAYTTTLGNNTTGCAFDSAGNLYVTAFSALGVVKFAGPNDDPHTPTSFGSGYSGHPESIVFDANGNVYVGAVDGDNNVRKFDPTGLALVAQFPVATENRGSDWIDITANQRTLFYTSEGRTIKRYDVSGAGAQLPDFATLPGVLPISVAFALRLLPPGDGSGGLLVADNANIKRLDGSGNTVQIYDAPGEDSWFALNLDPDGTSFWSGGLKTGNIYKFDIATENNILLGPIQTGGTASDKLGGLCIFGEKTAALHDSDGDGFPDNIEDSGYDAVDRNGNPVHVNLPDANKNRKDIYVYVDWLERIGEHSHKPDQAAIDLVVQAFANAPVCDKSGQNCGINLHVQFGNLIGETTGANGNQEIGSDRFAFGRCIYDWREFAEIKDIRFPKEFLPAYHYVIFGHYLPDGASVGCPAGRPTGISRGLGASDFIVAPGNWEFKVHLPETLTEGWATLFMHELGHNLGLGHGGLTLSSDGQQVIGPDLSGYKPNYLSVMNYSFSGAVGLVPSFGLRKSCRTFFFCDGTMDYSRFGPDVFPPLVESDLDETVGLRASNVVKDYGTRYYCPNILGLSHSFPQAIEPIQPLATGLFAPSPAVDWDCNNIDIFHHVQADINQEGGPAQTLTTVNEWPYLRYRDGSIGAFGPPIQLPEETEADEEIVHSVEKFIASSDRDALLISLVVDQNAVAPGGTVVYTTRVASNTGTDVTGVVISDTLPSGFSYQPGSTTGATTSDPVIISQTLVYPGPFTVGANDILAISFKVTSSNTPGIYLSSAQATGTNAPTVETGNTAPVTVEAAPPTGADLSITKTDSPDPVTAGDTLTYTLTISNAGPDDATNVTVNDTLPAAATFITGTFPGGTCAEVTGVVTCTVGTISRGGSLGITLTVTTTTTGVITNVATVASDTADPDPTNNSDAEQTTVTQVPPPTGNLLFISSRSSAEAGDIPFRDEDILAFDPISNTWAMVFDGEDVGITKDVNAFSILADGTLLLSFNGPTEVPGLGAVDDSDIVRFTPTALGNTTAGSFAWYLRGADVGLTTDGEDIDVIDFTTDGHLVVSTIGDFNAPDASGQDEDLFQLNNATFGNPSSGTWSLFFDGSSVGLANEDINGLWIDPTTGELYLTVKDEFEFAKQDIDSDDIFVCAPTQTGDTVACTYRLFWNGDEHDYGSENIDGIHIGALPPIFTSTVQAGAAEQAMDGDAVEEEDIDDLDVEENSRIFLPTIRR